MCEPVFKGQKRRAYFGLEYFESNRIWLPEDLCDEIHGFAVALRSVSVDFSFREEIPDGWKTVVDQMDKTVPALRSRIEELARGLISSTPEHDAQ